MRWLFEKSNFNTFLSHKIGIAKKKKKKPDILRTISFLRFLLDETMVVYDTCIFIIKYTLMLSGVIRTWSNYFIKKQYKSINACNLSSNIDFEKTRICEHHC